jgi:hypothetical protein
MSRRRQQPEAQIQRAVFEHLRIRPAVGVFAFHVPNGGWRSPIEAAILKGLGVVAGVPDIVAVRGGQMYCLELKAEGGRSTPAQIAAHSLLASAGWWRWQAIWMRRFAGLNHGSCCGGRRDNREQH